MSAQMYGFLYEEGDKSYLHIKTLGTGHQGAAALVRSVDDDKLYVRKTATYELDAYTEVEGAWSPEASNYREHPYINRLHSSQNHPHKTQVHTSLIFDFQNGGDLTKLVESYHDLDMAVPENIIWPIIRQLFDAISFLHHCCGSVVIEHNDIFPGNILVSWPHDRHAGPSARLADFGLSMAHPVERDPKAWARRVHDQEAAIGMASDYKSLADVLFYMMTGSLSSLEYEDCADAQIEDFARFAGHTYSPALLGCIDSLFQLADAIEEDISAERPELRALMKKESEWLIDTSELALERVRPAAISSAPQLFKSYKELMRQPVRPPGPWWVVGVDPETHEVLGKCEGPFCSETPFFTDQRGMKLKAR
jgi:serine/threonine protein kinase